ncbi:glucose-6-phosphate isomerase [Promicromonospora iranensis]|uniref:Glucose-6-phosphate isomerase n=1 Tax=Promicromonospora iranensis TaxID=1105144 RepID=A0ABU2CQE1_9MICO|nr:glucose-6-phosphate isomerase [Promicromonospora iranensis]MDR7383558.1 glucose-6-phosphate isomerase [Promicromonospora iranensis]
MTSVPARLPVDATTTNAWGSLTELSKNLRPDLRGWFAADPARAERLSHQAADLHVDLSKNLVTDDVLAALLALADEVKLTERRDAMFAGEHINVTEDRAVLHTALRRPAEEPLTVDGQDITADVQDELAKVYAFAEKVRSGEWTGVTGEPVRTIVNIGIGGSDLGPVMAYEALEPYVQDGLEVRFVSNIDPTDVAQKTADLDPTTTLFIVASKTFGTLETLTNARLARDWLWRSLVAAGAVEDSEEGRADAVAKHFVAVSTALDKVEAFGIDPENAFGFWDWVGGRYSVDSAIGTSLAVAIGPDAFAEFLGGFHAMDEHFRTEPLERNVPVLMGLLNVWYVNFRDAHTHAVLPYAQQLHRFPAYLQQLTMESNGKSVRWDGTPVTSDTGEVFWGEPGTNGQHAFYQLIHQGTRTIPADFIAVANPAYPLTDAVGDGGAVEAGADVHGLFLANFFAQTKALAFGKTADEVRAEGVAEDLVSAKVFSGNRPTTSILAPALTPSVLGQLVALYEHITFVQGVVWGIDSFDQWGVELGKKLALEIAPAVAGDEAALAAQDPSTAALIAKYRELRA